MSLPDQNYPVNVLPFSIPDTITWDYRLTIPRQDRRAIDYFLKPTMAISNVKLPESVRVAPSKHAHHWTRTDWLWSLIRMEVIHQAATEVAIREAHLAVLHFGMGKRYSGWRRQLERIVDRAIPSDCYEWISVGQERALQVSVPERWLGRLLFFRHDKHPERLDFSTTKKQINRQIRQASKLVRRGFLTSERVRWLEEKKRLMDGRLGLLYLPIRLVGHLAEVSPNQVNLITSLHRELTRVGGSRRVDKARVLTLTVPDQDEPVRLVSFNGNGGGKGNYHGYRLGVRVKRAAQLLRKEKRGSNNYFFWDDIRAFLDELAWLGKEVGIRGAMEKDDILPWDDLKQKLLDSKDREAVLNQKLFFYAPDDYLERWRLWLETRAGVVIPQPK